MFGLKLLLRELIIVNESKASASSTTKLCSETEEDDTVLVTLVQGGKLLLEIGFGNVGAGGVKDIEDELAAREKTVCDEFARTQSDRCRVISLEDMSEDQRTSGPPEGHPTLPNRGFG